MRKINENNECFCSYSTKKNHLPTGGGLNKWSNGMSFRRFGVLLYLIIFSHILARKSFDYAAKVFFSGTDFSARLPIGKLRAKRTFEKRRLPRGKGQACIGPCAYAFGK